MIHHSKNLHRIPASMNINTKVVQQAVNKQNKQLIKQFPELHYFFLTGIRLYKSSHRPGHVECYENNHAGQQHESYNNNPFFYFKKRSSKATDETDDQRNKKSINVIGAGKPAISVASLYNTPRI